MSDAPQVGELTPPNHTLMGPGPSDVPPRVLRSMATPLVGYLDPSFVEVMDDVQELLRYVFRTDNQYTLAVTGAGTAAMETAFANLVEPDDTVLVPTNGYFAQRMGAIAERTGADVEQVEAAWGEPLDADDVAAAFDEHDPTVFGFVHGETSTGVKQPDVAELADIARENDAYTIVDTVASLGGAEFRTDEWGVDVAYTGSQKCLSAPPGVSPITVGDRAMAKVRERDTPVRSWYLDLTGVWEYWDEDPGYHHTGPASTMYALREALRIVAEEGIEERWDRHRRVAGALKAGVEAMGLGLRPDDEAWLPTLNAVNVPEGVDDEAVISRLVDRDGIEIAGGLGDLSGEIFRVGAMGHSARPANVSHFMSAFGAALEEQGADVDAEAGIAVTSHELGA